MTEDKNLNQKLEEYLDIADSAVKMDEVTKVESFGTDKSILERINKKIITEDGRQLLI